MIDTDNPTSELKLVRLPEVLERTKLGKTTIYKLMKSDEFPQPRKAGRATLWRSSDLEDWMRARP